MKSSSSGEVRLKKNRYTVYFTLFCFTFGVLIGLTQFFKGFFPLTPTISDHLQAPSTPLPTHKLALILTDNIDAKKHSLIYSKVSQGHGQSFQTRSQVTTSKSVPFYLWTILSGITPTLADTFIRSHVLPQSNIAQEYVNKRVVYDGIGDNELMHSLIPHASRFNKRNDFNEQEGVSWDMLIAYKSAGRIDNYVENIWNAINNVNNENENAKGFIVIVGMNDNNVFLSDSFNFNVENKNSTNAEIKLVDICPTIACLMDMEIPAGNTGAVIYSLFGNDEEDRILKVMNDNAKQLEKMMNLTNEKIDNEDDFMIHFNHSMSSYKRYNKHKTKKNFISSLKYFNSFNKFVSDLYEQNFWGNVDLYRGFIGYSILVFTVLGIFVLILGLFKELKGFLKLSNNIEVTPILIALPPFLGSFHVMLCNSEDLNLKSPTCKGNLPNIIEVSMICLSFGFTISTLFNLSQIRFFVRYKEPLDTEFCHCMPDIFERLIVILSAIIQCSIYIVPQLLKYEQDIHFITVSVMLIGYIFSVIYKGFYLKIPSCVTRYWRSVRHICGTLIYISLIQIWKSVVIPLITKSDKIPIILSIISAISLFVFSFNFLRQERLYLKYGFAFFICVLIVGYGALLFTILGDPVVDLWPVVLCSSAVGILYAALWTFFPGTKAPRTSYITFHISSILCMVAPLPAFLFVLPLEKMPLILLVVLVCYHLVMFVYISDLPIYNSKVILYRVLLFCIFAKFVMTSININNNFNGIFTSLLMSFKKFNEIESWLKCAYLLAKVFSGPAIVFAFSVISVYQIARKQGSNGLNIFEQGALVACLTIFCVYICGPAVVAGAVFVLHLKRKPKIVWDSYGPKMIGMAIDSVFGIVVCIAFAVFSIVNRSLIIKTERERKRQCVDEIKRKEKLKKTQ